MDAYKIQDETDNIIKSEISRFETAFYEDSLWQGKYIGLAIASGGVVQYRRRVQLKKDIVKARVYLAAGRLCRALDKREKGDAERPGAG